MLKPSAIEGGGQAAVEAAEEPGSSSAGIRRQQVLWLVRAEAEAEASAEAAAAAAAAECVEAIAKVYRRQLVPTPPWRAI